jgi:AraC-like DNA-binding protein
VLTNTGRWIVPADRAVWIPAHCWHEHRFHGPARFHAVGVPCRSLRRDGPTVISVQPLLRALIVACSDPADVEGAERDRLLAVLVDQIKRSPDEPHQLPAARDDRLRRACEIVESDLSTAWGLTELGRLVGASDRTLTRLFRSEFAMTYPQWRTRLRLHYAVRYLANGSTVSATAHRCGWATTSAFIDVYRHAFGRTPGSLTGHRAMVPESVR